MTEKSTTIVLNNRTGLTISITLLVALVGAVFAVATDRRAQIATLERHEIVLGRHEVELLQLRTQAAYVHDAITRIEQKLGTKPE